MMAPNVLIELLAATNLAAVQLDDTITPVSLPEFLAFFAITLVAGVRRMYGWQDMFKRAYKTLRGNSCFREVNACLYVCTYEIEVVWNEVVNVL